MLSSSAAHRNNQQRNTYYSRNPEEPASHGIISMSLKYVFPKNAFERDHTNHHIVFSSDEQPLWSDGTISFGFPSAPEEPLMSESLLMTVDDLLDSIAEVPEEYEAEVCDFLSSIHYQADEANLPQFKDNLSLPLPPLFSPSPPNVSPYSDKYK